MTKIDELQKWAKDKLCEYRSLVPYSSNRKWSGQREAANRSSLEENLEREFSGVLETPDKCMDEIRENAGWIYDRIQDAGLDPREPLVAIDTLVRRSRAERDIAVSDDFDMER